MMRIILAGCNGYMGRVVTNLVDNDPEVSIAAGIDINTKTSGTYPVYSTPDRINEVADVIIDFSVAAALDNLLEYSKTKKIPLLICATGHSQEQLSEIEKASEIIPVFRSGNMSIGINLLADLIRRACAVLGEDFDIEIVERHHRRKIDAPSGTAILLADAAAEALPYDPEYTYERRSRNEPRKKQEIGISAVRGGTVVGIHDVIFAGQDEVIELRHTASSRDVFAAGALKAAKFMQNKPPGMYSMKNVLG